MFRCRCIKLLICVMLLVSTMLILHLNSYALSYDDNNIMLSDKKGDLICTLSGRDYYKAYDGWAIVAYFYCSTGYSGPILVSDKPEHVAFTTSYNNTVLTYGGTIEHGGETYYYSSTKYFMPKDPVNTYTNNLYRCNNGNQISVEDAAVELLEKYLPCDGKYKEHQDISEEILQEPTCIKGGTVHKNCLTCGMDLGVSDIAPIGHLYGELIVDKEATCREEGMQHHICINCDNYESLYMPKLEHSYGEYSVVSGNKLIPPIVKERKCVQCQHIDRINDWSYVWVTGIAVIVLIAVVVGVIGYIRAFKEKGVK